jgi:hypothetical protein
MMAAAKEITQADPLTRNPFAPVDLSERAKEKQFYKEHLEKNRNRLMDCLDPTVAKRYEEAKTVYEWCVKAQIFRAATKKRPASMERFEKIVPAQTERDAWAGFCDELGEWPAYRNSRVEISRLQKRKLHDLEG